MKQITILFLFLSTLSFAQMTSEQLLDKAIQYHDPNGKWESFNGILSVTMEIPDKSSRNSAIHIDLPNEFFMVNAQQERTLTRYTVHKGECGIQFNGRVPTEEEKKQHNLSCDRANLYKNYYTYLYGLPMKLKDAGTNIDPKVEKKTFKGKEYLVLKVTYDQEVGKDTWFFYFDPQTYAMEVYQFLKNSKPNTGEYILLTDLSDVRGIKMPKNRAWYYNADDKYLGTDILKNK